MSVSEPERLTNEGWRPTPKQIVVGVIVLVILIAILQNTRTGRFDFLWFNFEAPVWIWLAVNFGAGVATGLLIANRRAKRKASDARAD
jgi:uncharacterized integral membrane protein